MRKVNYNEIYASYGDFIWWNLQEWFGMKSSRSFHIKLNDGFSVCGGEANFSLCVLTVEWYDATSHTSFGGERKVEAKKSEVFRTEKNDEK